MEVILRESLIVSKVRKQQRKRHLGYSFQGSSTTTAPLPQIAQVSFQLLLQPVLQEASRHLDDFCVPSTSLKPWLIRWNLSFFTAKILVLYSVIQWPSKEVPSTHHTSLEYLKSFQNQDTQYKLLKKTRDKQNCTQMLLIDLNKTHNTPDCHLDKCNISF